MAVPDPVLGAGHRSRSVGVIVKPELLDGEGFAQLLGVEPGTIRKYTQRKRIPAPDYVLGGRPVWLRTTVNAWLAKGKPKPTEPSPPIDWSQYIPADF